MPLVPLMVVVVRSGAPARILGEAGPGGRTGGYCITDDSW